MPLSMRSLAASGVALALVVSGALAIGPRPAPARADAAGAQGERSGFSPGSTILWGTDAELVRDLDAMAATGARWLRMDFDWPSIEPIRGRLNWGPTDRVLNMARARGLRVLAMPAYTPTWARPAGTTDKTPPTDPAGFAEFVAAAAARYGPSGAVSAWEIWNEPNLGWFWSPRPDPASYTRLLRLASAAIRAAVPGATVLNGGLAPAPDAADGSQIAPTTFLQGIYAAGGGPAMDAVAVHPYSYPARPMDPASASWNPFYRMPLMHDLMVANGDGAKRIWGTEYGAPTAGKDAVTEAEQAAIVTEAYDAIARWSWTGPLFWYSQRDSGTDPANREDHFGLLRPDFSPKPAAAAFARAMTMGVVATAPQAAPVPPATPTPAAAPPAAAPQAAAPQAAAPAAVGPEPRAAASAPPRPQTYGLVASDGRVSRHVEGSSPDLSGRLPLVAGRPLAAVADVAGGGTLTATREGDVQAADGASFHGSLGLTRLARPVVGMAATPSGQGYWLVAADGGIFAFGDARFAGSTGAITLNRPIVGMAATPSGQGYRLVASDGGIFAFGDARFAGSTGAITLNRPIVGMAATPSGQGYWLVAADGGIFAFGDARFAGSTGAITLNRPIVGMAATPSGQGYWLVASDGGIFAFGDARFAGSAAGSGMDVIGVVAGS